MRSPSFHNVASVPLSAVGFPFRNLLFLVVFAAVGCAIESPPSDAIAAATAPSSQNPYRLSGPVVVGGQTTSGLLAKTNLDAQILGMQQAVARTPHVFSIRQALVHNLLARATFFGTWRDFDVALKLSAAGARDSATEPERTLRAAVLTALHRFDEALALVRPDSMAPQSASAASLADTIAVAREQDLQQTLSRREAAAALSPSYASLTDLAAARAHTGDFEGADAAWVAAAQAYRDVSPFPLAWIAFQRGVMWSEVADRPDLGRRLYQEALRRVPGYVVATVHLAELQSETDPAGAIARLDARATETDDAEPLALAGELLLASDPVAADERLRRAHDRYEQLLARHPLAFADHGSEFYAGPGKDPARALRLALSNLDNRPTERALLVALQASLAAEDIDTACVLAAQVPHEPVSVPLHELRDVIAKSCTM